MITQKIPDRRRYKTKRSWLTRWFTGGNHRTGELAHHAIDRIADENARNFAERAKAGADRHLAEADTEVLPRFGALIASVEQNPASRDDIRIEVSE